MKNTLRYAILPSESLTRKLDYETRKPKAPSALQPFVWDRLEVYQLVHMIPLSYKAPQIWSAYFSIPIKLKTTSAPSIDTHL